MLLADWILTSGNTAQSVDMLIGYLEKIDREDIIEVIQKAKGIKRIYKINTKLVNN